MKLEANWVDSLLEKFRQCRILVIGDLILDRFVWGRCSGPATRCCINRFGPSACLPMGQGASMRNDAQGVHVPLPSAQLARLQSGAYHQGSRGPQ